MPAPAMEQRLVVVELTEQEHRQLTTVARDTSREPGQYVQWLVRQLLAGQVRTPDELVTPPPSIDPVA